MMTMTLPMAPAVRFHLSLNVSDLERAVAFYRALFDQAPAKQRQDYAKFELDDPPLVLSLEPSRLARGGALNHLGFRLPDSDRLVALQRRLEMAGLRSQREEGVECCYAKQTKFWVTDPDNNLWEFYTLDGDLDHRGAGQTFEQMVGTSAAPAASWEHHLGEPVPSALAFASASLDEVRLRGSLNARLDAETQTRLLREAARVLRPGGRLFVHVLVADRPLPGDPNLPGPAAAVEHVPLNDEPLRLLEAAGFCRLERLKFGSQPCFRHEGVEMRELQLEGWTPAPA